MSTEPNNSGDGSQRPNHDPAFPPVLFALPEWIVSTFRWHAAAAVAINGSAIALNWAMGRPWWAIWVVVATVLVLGLHFLVYKAMTIDDAWVDARAEEIHVKSYDRGHIQEMSERRGLTTPADRIKSLRGKAR